MPHGVTEVELFDARLFIVDDRRGACWDPVVILWACCGGWLLFVWGMNLATPGAADDVPLRRAGCHGALQATWGCRWV